MASDYEIQNIADTLKGVPLQTDHSKSVRDTVGIVTNTNTNGNAVLYNAEVHDDSLAQKIKSGLIKECSVSLRCEKAQPFEKAGETWYKLLGVSVIELSLVLKD